MDNNNHQHDYLLKTIILGNFYSGKRQLQLRIKGDPIKGSDLPNIGLDFVHKTLQINQKKVKLQLWTIDGGERFRTITRCYYRDCRAVLFLYDVSDEEQFKDIEKFYNDFTKNTDPYTSCKFYLLANTVYPEKEDQVSTEQAMKYTQEREMEFFEISTNKDWGIQLLIKNLATSLLLQREKEEQEEQYKNIPLNNKKHNNFSNKCW